MISFTLMGIPPNWANIRLHHMELARRKNTWLEASMDFGRAARVLAGEPPAEEHDRHAVDIVIHKCGKPFDFEGAVAAMKPIIDGLTTWRWVRTPQIDLVTGKKKMLQIPGAGLIYDDDPAHIGTPVIRQERCAKRHLQRVVITVLPREISGEING